MVMINVADIKDTNDPQGRTFREINNATPHAIPIGALVELETKERLYVVQHQRDCDGEPLYGLSTKEVLERDIESIDNDLIKELYSMRIINGYSKESLKVIET